MPVVVAFGVSNTWGFTPGVGARMERDVRWPGVMARALGPSFQVIEEGLCGRTTIFDDPEEDGRNGLVYFAPCLRSHAPLDLVIISLGCNDVKARFAATPDAIAAGAERLIDVALASAAGSGGGRPRPSWSRRPRSHSLANTPRCSRAGRKRRSGANSDLFRPPIPTNNRPPQHGSSRPACGLVDKALPL